MMLTLSLSLDHLFVTGSWWASWCMDIYFEDAVHFMLMCEQPVVIVLEQVFNLALSL